MPKYDIVDEDAEFEMFGSNPVFVYHKTDKSNRPIRGYHTSVIKRWPTIPLYIKEAFHRTFTSGLQDRENERTTEIEWLKLLTKYRDELLTCSCGKQYIYGFSEKKPDDTCPYCGRATKGFCTLTLNRTRIILEPGKKIFSNHVDKYSSDYNTPVGLVVRNKNNPSLWGIKLNVPTDVQIKDEQGTIKDLKGDGVIPIVNNLKERFSDASIGEIKVDK